MVIGIDPGKNGALAVLGLEGTFVGLCPTPETPREMAVLIKRVAADHGGIALAVVEEARVIRKEGRAHGARSMLTYGTNYGTWLGILAALEVPYEVVRPTDWFGKVVGRKKGEPAKKRTLAYVQARWPEAGLTSRRKDVLLADALAIAEYGRRFLLAVVDG